MFPPHIPSLDHPGQSSQQFQGSKHMKSSRIIKNPSDNKGRGILTSLGVRIFPRVIVLFPLGSRELFLLGWKASRAMIPTFPTAIQPNIPVVLHSFHFQEERVWEECPTSQRNFKAWICGGPVGFLLPGIAATASKWKWKWNSWF